MRIKVRLKLDRLKIAENCLKVKTILNTEFLGNNNKYHNMDVKPYSISMILGGKKDGEYIIFKNDAHIFFNTNDNDVLDLVLDNIIGKYEFEIVSNKIRTGVNRLTASNVRYYSKSKNHFISEDNKKDFETYLKNSFGIDIKILAINNKVDIKYKNGSGIPTTNLFIEINDDEQNIQKVLDKGIGATTAQGFGFVDNFYKKEI